MKTVHRQDSSPTQFLRQFPTELKTVHRHFWRQFTDTMIISKTNFHPVHGNTELHEIYQIIPSYTALYRITPPNTDLNMQKTYLYLSIITGMITK